MRSVAASDVYIKQETPWHEERVVEMMETARLLPTHPSMDRVSDELFMGFERILTGVEGLEDGMGRMKTRIDAILEEEPEDLSTRLQRLEERAQ